jgi:hypothetical protein
VLHQRAELKNQVQFPKSRLITPHHITPNQHRTITTTTTVPQCMCNDMSEEAQQH